MAHLVSVYIDISSVHIVHFLKIWCIGIYNAVQSIRKDFYDRCHWNVMLTFVSVFFTFLLVTHYTHFHQNCGKLMKRFDCKNMSLFKIRRNATLFFFSLLLILTRTVFWTTFYRRLFRSLWFNFYLHDFHTKNAHFKFDPNWIRHQLFCKLDILHQIVQKNKKFLIKIMLLWLIF